jgi:hypothetical protein
MAQKYSRTAFWAQSKDRLRYQRVGRRLGCIGRNFQCLTFISLLVVAYPRVQSQAKDSEIGWHRPQSGDVWIRGQDSFVATLTLRDPQLSFAGTCNASLWREGKQLFSNIIHGSELENMYDNDKSVRYVNFRMDDLEIGTYTWSASFVPENASAHASSSHVTYRVQEPLVDSESQTASSATGMRVIALLRARNAERSIQAVLRSLKLFADGIIVLDDASEDKTMERVVEVGEECRVLQAIEKAAPWRPNRYADMQVNPCRCR